MSIKVLYFASLREEIGRGSDNIDIADGDHNNGSLQITQLWTKATGRESLPDELLVAINQEYTSADALVKDGDEVAFFPPVTGG
ncbi:MAG TPA: molybdopterin converting factor subunit 1 [Leucothrix sp.]|nr:molybdopterin converting factor subunit 1 [Leucothrix sp.]